MNRKGILSRYRMKAALLLLGASIVAAGCTNTQGAEPENGTAESKGLPKVKIEQVGRHSMGEPREQIGEVTAAIKFDMIAKTGGEVVERVKQNGDTVKKNDVIARISSERADAQLENAQTQVRIAREALAASSKSVQLQREKLLKDIKDAENAYKEIRMTQDDTAAEKAKDAVELLQRQLSVMDSSNNVAQLEASVASAEAGLKEVQLSLGDYVIKAPSDGVLTNLTVREGSYLQAGSVIGVVQQTERIVIEVKLTEKAAELVRGKKELVFYSADGSSGKLKARINSVDLFANPSTRLFAMELEADNPGGVVKPGSRVHVQLTTEDEENVVAIPSLSVVREGDETFVFVAKGSVAEKRKIELGRMKGSYQEVLSGLAVSDQLVVSGQHQLADQAQIEIES